LTNDSAIFFCIEYYILWINLNIDAGFLATPSRFVNSFVFYGLSLSATSLGGNDYLDFFVSGLVEVPAYLLCLVTLSRFGRPRPLSASLGFAGLVLVAIVAVPHS